MKRQMMPGDPAQVVQPCIIPGCTELVTGGYGVCMPHVDQFLEELRLEKLTVPPSTTQNGKGGGKDKSLCVEEGCYEPRRVSSGGYVYPRCKIHQRAKFNEHNENQRKARAAESAPDAVPPARPETTRLRITITNISLSFDLDIEE